MIGDVHCDGYLVYMLGASQFDKHYWKSLLSVCCYWVLHGVTNQDVKMVMHHMLLASLCYSWIFQQVMAHSLLKAKKHLSHVHCQRTWSERSLKHRSGFSGRTEIHICQNENWHNFLVSTRNWVNPHTRFCFSTHSKWFVHSPLPTLQQKRVFARGLTCSSCIMLPSWGQSMKHCHLHTSTL
jgi:hypothetical protein